MNTIVTFVIIEIVAEQPFSVRHGDSRDGVDAVVVVDHHGFVHTPATGLIGSLRSHLSTPDDVLGSAKPESGDDKLTPSPLRALGTSTCDAEGNPIPASTVRTVHRTAIDRSRGAARTRTLRSAQQVAGGAQITLFCEYVGELPSGFVDELRAWSPFLGSSRTSGSGRARVRRVLTGALDLASAEGLALALGGGGPSLARRVATEAVEGVSGPSEAMTFTATIVDALFIGGGETGTSANASRSLRDGDGRPIIEGTSIKGVLRSRVAFIASSILGAIDPVLDVAEIRRRGDLVADAIFGSTSRRGMLSVDAGTIEGHQTSLRPHVGIDRFSGGATPGLLFSHEVLSAGTFTISLRPLERLPEEAMALLLAALSDIDAGFVGFGGMTSRGYGTVTLSPSLPAALPLDQPTIDWVLARSLDADHLQLEESHI